MRGQNQDFSLTISWIGKQVLVKNHNWFETLFDNLAKFSNSFSTFTT